MPYGTPPALWVLQRGVLWWHRTPYNFQGPSVLDLEGPFLPVSLAGGWPLTPVIPPLVPEIGPERKPPAPPYLPGQSRRLCQGWPSAKMPTSDGVTSAVLHRRTVGACMKNPRGSPRTPPILQLYWPEMLCWYFRKNIPCEILGICKLVHVNKNFSYEGSFHFVDQARYATSIVAK